MSSSSAIPAHLLSSPWLVYPKGAASYFLDRSAASPSDSSPSPSSCFTSDDDYGQEQEHLALSPSSASSSKLPAPMDQCYFTLRRSAPIVDPLSPASTIVSPSDTLAGCPSSFSSSSASPSSAGGDSCDCCALSSSSTDDCASPPLPTTPPATFQLRLPPSRKSLRFSSTKPSSSLSVLSVVRPISLPPVSSGRPRKEDVHVDTPFPRGPDARKGDYFIMAGLVGSKVSP